MVARNKNGFHMLILFSLLGFSQGMKRAEVHEWSVYGRFSAEIHKPRYDESVEEEHNLIPEVDHSMNTLK